MEYISKKVAAYGQFALVYSKNHVINIDLFVMHYLALIFIATFYLIRL